MTNITIAFKILKENSSPERQHDGASAAPDPVHHGCVGQARRNLPPHGKQLVAREWPSPAPPYPVVGINLFNDGNAILVVGNPAA